MNLYAYAGNNPISFGDPFGLCPPDDEVPCSASDYWALRSANGQGSSLVNNIMGALSSCGESVACNLVLDVASFGAGTVESGAVEATEAGEAIEGGSEAVVRGGETAATKAGREAHAAYSEAKQAEGYTTNRAIEGTRLRPDAIKIEGKTGVIRELKPNNAAAIRRGLKQLKTYKDAAEKAYPGVKFTTHLDTY